jgi:outer membrane receptor for ferrienterochelin and colicin
MIRKKFINNGGKIMFRKLYTFIFLILVAFSFTYAQTGRVAGKVTDKQTGEPLIGANVIIVGTSLGAASDINGDYIIRQVSPGNYTVRASYLGYQDVDVSELRVVSGLTTDLDFQLPSSEIATKEVVIVSQRPLIEKTSTNAIRVVGAEDISNLPVRSIDQIVALQPGIVLQNGLTSVRGSRPDETGYLLEGADVKNILSHRGGSNVDVIPDALQEITVQAGGYTAEYGNANAGIVSQDFRTGTSDYHFSLRAETDNFGNYPGDKFLGTYSYGYSDYTLTMSGPIFTDKLKIFLSGENFFQRDHNPQFFYANPTAFSDGALLDTTKVYDSGFYGGRTTDYQYLAWNAGNVPGEMDNRYTGNGTLIYDNSPLILRLAGAYTWERTRGSSALSNAVATTFATTLIDMFNTARLPVNDASNLLLNLKGTYLTSPKSFIEANISFYDQRGLVYDPIFGSNLLDYSDSLAASQYGWQYSTYTSPPPEYDFYGFPFNRPGTWLVAPSSNTANGNLQAYSKDHNNYIGGSVAYTAQIQKHALKLGGSIQSWTIRHFAIGDMGTILSGLRGNPDMAANTDSLEYFIGKSLYTNWNNYGYDIFGNEISSSDQFGPKHPVFASGYIEDRIEVSDLIINAGLRYDYINMDSWAWANPQEPTINYNTHTIPDSSFRYGSKFSYISPRLGFSFPVTDQTVFHLQYGKFVQSPGLAVAFRGVYQAAYILQGGHLFVNPLAYNPEPVRTTQYEIGFSQQFSDYAAFDITAFYKDIKGQIQYAEVPTTAGAAATKYEAYTNQDFSTTKGLELSLKLRRIERVRAQIDYTYSDASGTNSFAASAIGSLETNNQTPTILLPLDYNQTHRGSVSLDYRFEQNDGGPILSQLGIDLLFTFNSGHPYTIATYTGLGQESAWQGGLTPAQDSRGRRPYGAVNGQTTPWVYNLDLRIDKTVNISNFNVNFYVYVSNVLNTKNVINVYDKTGNAYSDGFLQTSDGQKIISQPRYTERFADLYQALNYDNNQAAITQYGYTLFGTPRQLRLGAVVSF